MPDILVLGPQFRSPNIRDALARSGLSGPIVSITAGWQEREGELAALEGHLGQPVRDLRLYERAEAVFNQDAELHETHRLRGRPTCAACRRSTASACRTRRPQRVSSLRPATTRN